MADELVSEAGLLTFDPTTEFQVLEEFDHDERIQRPEALRFFTLEQQTTDYIQKLLPKTGRVPKGVLKESEHEVDTMRELYQRILRETPEGYELIPPEKRVSLPWVVPYTKSYPSLQNPTGFERWRTLFSDANRGIQYTNILDALPKFSQGGDDRTQKELPVLPSQTLVMVYSSPVDIEGRDKDVILLGDFIYNNTAYRNDGSYTIAKIPRPGTHDTGRFTGYKINPPPVEFPNPLDDNPFLNRRTEPVKMETNEPLEDLLPSFELIMEHAVPSTTKPYVEAQPFLKIWDIQLTDIPWVIWKAKFASEETVSETLAPEPLAPPTTPGDEQAPSSELQGIYETTWSQGIASRFWLSRQIDAGQFVSVALLSKVSAMTPISVPPPLVGEDEGLFPSGTAEDCIPTNVQSFEDFAGAGVYRPGVQSAKENEPGWKGTARCVPLTFIQREQEDVPYRNRKPWLPDTDSKLLQEYQSLLRERILPKQTAVRPSSAAPAGKPAPINETRAQILALLKDTQTRLPEDIAADILLLLKSALPEPVLTNHIYSDSATGTFLVCEHTLRSLEGEFDRDPKLYLKQWGAEEGGKIVCRYCGDTITDEVFTVKDQFDENGRPIVTYRKLETKQNQFIPDHSTRVFAESLFDLKKQFDLTSPAEDMLYLIITLLQVLPENDKLKPFLDVLKTEGAKLKPLIQSKDETKSANAQLVSCMLGFSAAILLIQTHMPMLIPRKSVGPRPIVTRGFPRDTTDLADAPFVDGVMNLLRRSFEQFPTTFKGASVVFIRVLIKNQKGLRTKVLSTLQKLAGGPFKAALISAKDMVRPMDTKEEPTFNTFDPPKFRFEAAGDLKPGATLIEEPYPPFTCTDPLPAFYTGVRIFPLFSEVQIVSPIVPAPTADVLPPAAPFPLETAIPPTQLIRNRARIGLPRDWASPTYAKLVESNDAIQLQKSLDILLDAIGLLENAPVDVLSKIRAESRKATGDPSLLRDFFKGLFFELARSLSRPFVVQLERSLQSNLAIKAITTSETAAKSVRDKLRAEETAAYKKSLREMSDVGRDITKKLQDLGIGVYLVTKYDRETFMRELSAQLEGAEPPDENVVAPADGLQNVAPEDANQEDDVGEQGNAELNDNGEEDDADNGDYGDRRARATRDGEEVGDLPAFNPDEGYGA